ncbi:hypothetical protein V6N13_041940 [Hibiscus sabdariffa]|uniref:Uncharacterized protein n=1 Tax=Hibiscus sabdariffa TaxID=183260 RepID=A0ABR2DDI1_9ROSI
MMQWSEEYIPSFRAPSASAQVSEFQSGVGFCFDRVAWGARKGEDALVAALTKLLPPTAMRFTSKYYRDHRVSNMVMEYEFMVGWELGIWAG